MASGGGGDGDFGLQIAPMLDVLFVLLLFFMVSTGSQKREAELGIKLPSRGTTPGAPETPINLKIGTDNQVFFNDSSIDTPKSKDLLNLQAKLVDILEKFGSKQPVVIIPTATTKHERVVDVLNACSAAGVKIYLLEHRPLRTQPSSLPMHAPRKENKLVEWMLRSRYFLAAFLLHLLIFFLIGSFVIFKAYIKPTEIFDGFIEGGGGDSAPPPPAANPVDTIQDQTVEVSITTPTQSNATDILSVESSDPSAFKMNVAPVPLQNAVVSNLPTQASQQVASNLNKSGFDSRSEGVREFTKGWGAGGAGGTGGAQGKGTALKAKFVCYVAKYADGDWNHNSFKLDRLTSRVVGVSDNIIGGAIPNLMRFVNLSSRGRIDAEVVGKPLDLASPEIFEKRPPFIYFTGHKDFKLRDVEIENLRKYLIRGGAIWGDNALAGKGSRFDVAFRREMKRVVPDEDKQFKVVPDNHPMFVQSFFTLKGAPAGMNYSQEPLEVIEIDGFIAVVYTPNNYGDLMRVRFKEGSGNKEIDTNNEKNKVATPRELVNNPFFRNFDAASAEQSFQLGTNIIEHLLTRFQDRLEFAN